MSYEVKTGDSLSVLPTLEAGSVQTCITSPPYFGLRDYGTARWEGGDESCDHSVRLGGNGAASAKQTTSEGTQRYQYRGACGRCGARRTDSQIGLEETPETYVARLVGVFREVRRVLKDDGTLWLNLGDSYASQAGGYDVSGSRGTSAKISAKTQAAVVSHKQRRPAPGLKPKDLIGIPWMVAFALRADGWYLRSDIIWHKPNPMPESVTDRPTKAHEYLFLLSKSPTYYFDAEAIKEPVAASTVARVALAESRNGREAEAESKAPVADGYKRRQSARVSVDRYAHGTDHLVCAPKGDKRNKRSVWTVSEPMCRLRSDITPEQRAYVLRRIADAGSL